MLRGRKVQLDNFLLSLERRSSQEYCESLKSTGNTKIFGWKGTPRKTQDARDMKLNRQRGIEEEDMRL
jgi:hypothetical protein